jgi:hypothetical protein
MEAVLLSALCSFSEFAIGILFPDMPRCFVMSPGRHVDVIRGLGKDVDEVHR